ncbi:MAG TPA: ABC transporter permease [Polyangia bacterium]|jgi:ABC-type transport system involved in multi-copper enzyme maturation permease subunit|nr:ABC transporter permease [Polyangia bacterium]
MATGTRIHARLSWTRLKRGRMAWAAAAMFALPLAYVGGLAIAGHFGRGLFDEVNELYFRFLVPFVPTLLLSSAVAEEVENKTFTFVFARPAPRGSLVLGKWIAATLPALAVIVPSIAISWTVANLRFPDYFASEWPHLLRVEAAAVLGLAFYGALAATLGSAFSRHPLIVVLLYLVFIEEFLGAAPIVLDMLAASWHLRNLAGLPLPPTQFLVIAVPAWLSALLLAVVTPALLALCMWSVTGAEYRTDR